MSNETPANHYVDNKLFYDELVNRKNTVDKFIIDNGFSTQEFISSASHIQRKEILADLKEKNIRIPKITNSLGEIFIRMANNIIFKYNFNRYPFKDEMISDGIMDCLKYVDSFDVDKMNPFAYFTTSISRAFIRRIIKEKKQGYIKTKVITNMDIDLHELQEHDEDGEFINAFKEYMNAFNNFDGSFFEKNKKDKSEKQFSTIEDFFEEEKCSEL